MTADHMIHLVDDEEALRRSVSFLLKTSGHIVTTWESGAAFLKNARLIPPGCVLLDIRMPDIDGLEVQRMMAEQGIAMPVVILTGHGDIGMAVASMKAGAVDFLEKPFEKAALLAAVDNAFRRLEGRDHARDRGEQAKVRIAALTPRERDVLSGLARGLANKLIALDLDISPRTVEIHRANLMTKLGVASLSDALRLAFAADLGGE